MQDGTTEKRRHTDRRDCAAEMGERGMRCEGCGTVWYSAMAPMTVRWARCVACHSPLHLERRASADRRGRLSRTRLVPLSRLLDGDAA